MSHLTSDLTLGVADPARAAAFYGAVLGWCPPTVADAVWPGARLAYAVADVAAAVAAVRAVGCQATDRGEARDPFGLSFTLVAGSIAPRRFSALLYVPDAETARSFYTAVLGGPPPVRIVVGRGRPGVIATYEVGDVAAAADLVRAAGGTATDDGLCTDDQGLAFYLTTG